MPGLVGFTKSISGGKYPRDIISAMQNSVIHFPFHCRGPVFENLSICASQVYIDKSVKCEPPCLGNGIYVWLDGELYNKDSFGLTGSSDEQIIYKHYKKGTLINFLQKADGIFSAVIYDETKNELIFVNDRYGLRYLYLLISSKGCVWASELKAFRCLPSISLTINKENAACFLSEGYFPGDLTWFNEVSLLAPASLITIKCDTMETICIKYSDWTAPKIINKKIDIHEAAGELGNRFKAAVERRCRRGGKVGLGLSGGLDSRAIFAAIPQKYEPVHAFTFGIAGSNDLKIARRVASLRSSKHYFLEISLENWIEKRLRAVWLTDGMFNMMHMHGIEHAETIREKMDVVLNGFQSDMLLGACYEREDGREVPKSPDRDRRFIAMGIALASQSVICRIPFFDYELMDFTMSVPLRYRRNSHLYHIMLLKTFPEYYYEIPWQRTGMPISKTGIFVASAVFSRKCIERFASKLNLRIRNDDYTDYPSWIRQDPGKRFFTELLTGRKSYICEFVNADVVRTALDRHLRGFDYSEMIGRYATLEIYMKELYDRSFFENITNGNVLK